MAPRLLLDPTLRFETDARDHACRQGVASKLQTWPTRLAGDLVWTGSQFRTEEEYVYYLTAEEKVEVGSALAHFNGLGLDGSEVCRDNFPLPTLQHKLQHLTLLLHRGRGFFSIRGLRPCDYSPEDNIIIFLGVSSYVAEKKGKQDDEGNLFAHIREAKKSKTPQQDRPIRYSNLASHFHNDMLCDVVAMQTRRCAAIGGKHTIASAWTVYNELAATRPDLLELLAEPNWTFESRGRILPTTTRPLIHYHDGRIILNFLRQPLIGLETLPRPKKFPQISPKQLEALDAIESVARKHQLAMNLQPGDLTFINNFGILHARGDFQDTKAASRYHVRMWLKNETLAWKLPRSLKEGNKAIFETRGGEVEERWNIVAVPRLSFVVQERLCS